MITESWQSSLVKAYLDYRWHRLMNPLCNAFQRWKAGLADYTEMEQALDRAYQDKCALRNLGELRLDHMMAIIQVSDREWFLRWIEEHHPSLATEMPET